MQFDISPVKDCNQWMKLKITRYAIALAVLLMACSENKPTITRNDLQFGYFGSVGDQPQATREHVNIFMDMQFGGEQYTIDSIKYMGIPIILGIEYWMYNAEFQPKPNAEANLRDYLTRLQTAGVLKYVTDVYPVDEPDVNRVAPADIKTTNDIIRRVFSEFSMAPRLNAIYGAQFTWPGVQYYDDVGFDNYSAGANIFVNGDYARLKGALRPDQRIWLVPGGASPWKQDPKPFVDIANGDPQVRGIIAFVYFDSANPTQGYGLGIRSNGMLPAYCRVGATIAGKPVNC